MQNLYDQARDRAFEARRIWRAADREKRELDDDERARMETLLDESDDLRKRAKKLGEQTQERERFHAQVRNVFGDGPQTVLPSDPNQVFGERPGDRFIASKGYQAIRDSATRPSNWSSGPVEVKATLLEGDLDTPGEGGALSQFDVRPGVTPVLFQPVTVASLIASATTSSNRVRGDR